MSKSRYIPKKVSDQVKKDHYFECAWCTINLTERHHITHYSKGGEHSVDNLILLCPNCHTMLHQGQISTLELLNRKSHHKKGDRLQGNFMTTLKEIKLKYGSNYLESCKHILGFNYQSILSVESENNKLLFNANLYDSEGNLTFWMRKNIYWTPSHFTVTSSNDLLIIHDNNINKTHIKLILSKDRTYLNIELNTFYLQSEVIISNEDFIWRKGESQKILTINNCFFRELGIAIWLTGTADYDPYKFLELNK